MSVLEGLVADQFLAAQVGPGIGVHQDHTLTRQTLCDPVRRRVLSRGAVSGEVGLVRRYGPDSEESREPEHSERRRTHRETPAEAVTEAFTEAVAETFAELQVREVGDSVSG